MKEHTKRICNDFGDRPECQRDPDSRYTMYFDDIGEEPIYWCSFCGPGASMLEKSLTDALQSRGPEFQKEMTELIAQGMTKTSKH